MSRLLALAGLSVRMLAEAAREGGFRAVALDLFGDADTRRAAEAWLPIGDPTRLAIDRDALFAALRGLRAEGASGWIAGSGFEADSGALAAGAQLLPLIGNAAEVVSAVRDPANFCSRLGALDIPHPETRLAPPPVVAGWLRKNAGSSGGREVSPVDQAVPAGVSGVPLDSNSHAGNGGIHYQRLAPGQPMSVLFLADGRRSRVLGVNRQIVCRLGRHPFVFRGCIGPLPVARVVRTALQGIVDALAADFGLRGLNGLDFLLDGERLAVLELNPRPPASIALYPDALPGGLIRAHLAASLDQRLPAEARMGGRASGGWRAEAPTVRARVRGIEVVFARAHHRIDAAAADALARRPWCHDLPQHGSSIPPGAPLCTVSAVGSTAAEVQALLLQRRRQIPFLLEQHDESSRTFSPESGVPGQHVLECQ